VYQENWNIDKLDGTGVSGYNLDNQSGNIYRIEFSWYGYGNILYGVIGNTKSGRQDFIPCHRMSNFNDTSIASPNLRVFAEVENRGTPGNSIQVNVGGREYSIIGKYEPKFRFTSEYTEGVSAPTTGKTPLISFRRKVDDGDVSLKIQGFESLVASNPCYFEVYLNPTLTGASFGNPTDADSDETAMVSDTSATAMSGGTLIFRKLMQAGANANQSVISQTDLNFDIPNGQIITLAAQGIGGTSSITSAVFDIQEEW
jgi:hypothetical protein